MPKTYTVSHDFNDSRFDKWFKLNVLDIPQSLIQKIIRQNKVKVNKKKTKTSYRVQEGDTIVVYDISKIKPKKNISIIKYKPNKQEVEEYDDYIIENNENFIVLNKPAGIPVQSGTKSFRNIIDVIKDTKYFENSKPFIVHRIDKDTSGILIVAKNREFAQLFTSLFRIRKIHKSYLALTYGQIKISKTLIDDLTIFDKGKKITQKAISHLKIIKSNKLYSYVELKPVTGRKHQLRKQLLNLGNPIIGDKKYFISNNKNLKIKNLMLHSYKVKFMIKNIKYNFKANYSENFGKFLNKNF